MLSRQPHARSSRQRVEWRRARSTRRRNKSRSPYRFSCLFQLQQRAGEILGMQEQDRLAMGPDLGLAVSQDASASRLQPVTRDNDVVDLVADMMDTARRILVEKARDRGGITQRRQKLDLRVGQF